MANALELGTRYRTVVHSAPSVPFSSGNVQSVELPKGFLYKTVALRLRGEFDGTAGAAAFGSDIPLALLQRVEIIADGRKTLVNAAGRDLYRLCQYTRSKAGEMVPPASFVVVNQPFSATFLIDLEAVRMGMTNDSLFDPNPYEKIELRITWGTVASISAGGTPTIDPALTFVDVQVLETTVGANMILFNKLISFDEVPILSTQSALRVRVPRSGLLHSVLFRQDRDSASVENIVNRITLQSDNTFNHVDSLRWDLTRHRNTIEYQIETHNVAAAAVPPNYTGAPGFLLVDVTEDGLMSSALNTLDLNALDFILDVTFGAGSQLVRMTHVFYEPVIVAAAP